MAFNEHKLGERSIESEIKRDEEKDISIYIYIQIDMDRLILTIIGQ